MQNVIQGFRLSPQQKRLWELQRETTACRAWSLVRVEGPLDLGVLRQAFQSVIDRHEVLRTRFYCPADMSLPLQQIKEGGAPAWHLEDLTTLSPEQQEFRIEELLGSETSEPFDFEQGPLLRINCLTLSSHRRAIIITLPSLCADGQTLRNLVHDLARCYNACRHGSDGLDEPTQYVQFSEWQNELQEEEDEAGRNYWRGRYATSALLTTLPYERKAGPRKGFEPGLWAVPFAPDLTEKLSAVRASTGARTGDILLACWYTLLWRLTARQSILLGVEFDGRKYDELSEALGLFAKCLPVQQDFEGDPSFGEVVQSLSESCREASAWEEYFTWEECFPSAGSEAEQRSFAVQFSFAEWPAREQAGDLQLNFERHYSCIEPYKLKLRCLRADDSLSAEFHFDAGSISPEHVQLIARCFERLVRGVVSNPELRAGEFEIVSESDARQLSTWARPSVTDNPPQLCVHQLFEEQAGRIPEAEAVVYDGRQLTYAQLDARANQLAHYLRRRGVGPNVIVGLCLSRSLEMLVGLWGVLKAGGAYLPLDPEHPPTRLAYQLSESKSPVLLTEEALVNLVPEFDGEVICLDRDWKEVEGERAESPKAHVSPTDLAYVIFTSGSTGGPKGVEITHRSLVNYSSFISRTLGLDEASAERLRFATVSTLSADLGNTCIFPSLISGGCLHILDYEIATDGEKFADYMAAHPIDVLKIVPSHLNALLPSLQIRNVFPRRYLILGGETLSFELLRRISEVAGECRVFNHYGPTETTVGSLMFPVTPGQTAEAWAASVPIGRPIANTEIHILDERRRAVPPGLQGELYIGGLGLAQGYLTQPEQTKARFIQNPFSTDPAARLYRTGDLARFLPDGNVEFCGRVDHQVKIRGYRIELGEIENALREHSNIREAVVQAREDEFGHKHLVAYCVPQHEPAPPSAELTNALKHKLPAYMVPQIFINLKTLPLTSNGKVARQLLPEPRFGPSVATTVAPPRTVVEKELAAIWKEVLGVKEVGIYDNFFELGGDSILSIQIIARARQAGLAVSPKQVFDHLTIAGLAEVVVESTAPSLDQGLVSGALPLLPIQRWFLERDLPDPHHYNQAILLEVKQPLGFSAVEQVVRELLLHHDALRLRFVHEETGWRQFYAAPEAVSPFIYLDLSATPEREEAGVIETEAAKLQLGFDLSAGPLARIAYFDFGTARPARLLLAVHHLLIDGVSWRILVEDLVLAWGAVGRGEQTKLPPKSTSFKAWADRLAAHAQSGELRQEAASWLAEERRAVQPLPVDSKDGQNTLASAHTISTSLDEGQTHALLHDVSEAYHTQINDLLLTALAQACARWSGHRSLLVDMEGHGREPLFDETDVTRTVGWFTTRFPVLLKLGETTSAGEALKSVKEQLRQVPNRGIGYGLLRYLTDDAGLVERLRSLPQPEVSFNYLGQLDHVLPETAPFKLAPEGVPETQSRRGNLSHLLRVNASVSGGQLQVQWTYSRNVYEQATVENLGLEFQRALQSLIADCLSSGTASYTPSDFPDAALSQKDLDLIVAKTNETGERGAGRVDNLEDIYTLSPMQDGMLFQSLYNREGDAYFRQMGFVLHGELNFAAFEQAWQRVVERHPPLRTSFFWDGKDRPVQVVQRKVPLPLEVLDWRRLSPRAREEQLQTYLREQPDRPFKLDEAPLMRLALIRLEDQVHQFVWSYHHILIDGWSRALIYKEVLALYEALCEGREATLEARRPYRDYIRWLRQQDLARAEVFWRERLRGVAPLPPLGAPRSPELTAATGDFTRVRSLALSAELTNSLQSLARGQQLTLSTLVQGAWAVMLARLCGVSEVVFGVVASGRANDLPGIELMIGPFLNTLPTRVQLAPAAPVLTWLRQLQRQQLELREFEYSPLSDVQRWSQSPRGKALFETVVNYANYFVDSSLRKKHELIEVRDPSFVERTHYPMVLDAEPGPTLRLSLLHDSRLFDEESIAVALSLLESVLRKMTTSGEGNLEELLVAGETDARPRKLLGIEPPSGGPSEAPTVAAPDEMAAAAAVGEGQTSETFRAGQLPLILSKQLSDSLRSLTRREGVTLFTTLLAAFQVLLHRYTHQDEVVVGALTGGGTRPESENLTGLLNNVLVLRSDLSANPSFRELLHKVRETTLRAPERQDVPFEKSGEGAALGRDLGRQPLFRATMIYWDTPVIAPDLGGLSLRSGDPQGQTAERSDLDVYVWEGEGRIHGALVYDADLFEAAAIERMSRRLVNLLESIVADADCPVAHLQIGESVYLPEMPGSSEAQNEFPLSYHQERLWFIDQFETGNVYELSPTYHNLPLVLHLTGPVDEELLESSLNAIIDRHEALRTRIITENARTRQVVRPVEALKLQVIEAPDSAGQPPIERLMEMALAETRRPFILDQERLVRAVLLRSHDRESILVVTVHHIIADRRSLRLIADELAVVYSARSEGRELQLPEPAVQYHQYSQWQLQFPADVLEPLLFYWKWQLRGRLRGLELPEDRPRAAVHTFTAASQTFSLNKRLARGIDELSRRERSTPSAVVLAAFTALLHRYARQEEILVGTTAPCRNQPGLEKVVGPLANLLVLRSNLGGNPTFRDCLAQATRAVEQAYAHQDMPFDKLVLELNPEKDMSRTALFDVLFNFEDEESAELKVGQARARVIDTNLGYGKYDLNLSVRRGADGLFGTLVYNADIYDDSTMSQMMRHFEVILDAVTSIPDRHIDDVVMLSEEEEYQQVVAWNQTQASYPGDETIHRLFESQAQKTPAKTAVVDGDTSLTYRELDRRANQLAHHLRSLGVAPDVLVAVHLDKSPEMIITLLAILKAGGAYLPLNPEFPEERLRFMIEDSRTTHLITVSGGSCNVAEQIPSVIYLDKDRDRISAQPVTPPPSDAAPHNVAYCIYTSGSTGKPKGVLVEHRNVVRLMVSDPQPFTFTQDDVWTMFHSYSFDFSVWEMYGALLYGGTLVLVSGTQMKDPVLFLDLLRAERVTVLNQTPSAFAGLAGEALKQSATELALRYVIFGGEELHATQLRGWKKLHPAVKLINMYGITETTVHVTFKEVTDHEIEQNVSNIGRPIPTTTTYIMDSNLRLLPVGVPGEVCVGGDGVSRGYLDRDHLNRQKFVSNPYKPEERIYRSGDLAKFLRNGEMVYLGRIDDQVQIRGFRVELGEVRSHLLEHPLVAKAEVVAGEMHADTLELVAYVESSSEVSVTELRNHLARTLPHYMVPSAFVMLKSLPMTANGKVDRKALPPPNPVRDLPRDVAEAPLNLVEEVVAGIWAEVLGIEGVNPGDNFLELGGHSLMATRVFSRIREAFQVELPLKTLFDAPTLSELAGVIEKAMGTDPETVSAPLVPVARDRDLPASFGQHGLWLINQLEPQSHLYNMPFALRLKGRLDITALEHCLAALLERHESLRTTFAADKGQPRLVIRPSAQARLLQHDLRELPEGDREAEAHRLAVEEARKPFDLERGPLLRTTLLRLAEEEQTLLFTMHHIVSDGWSLEVLGREVAILYEAYSSGAAPALQDLPIQYADYAFWQRENLRGERLDRQLDYWRRQLDGMEPLRLPPASKRPAARTDLGASEHVMLSGSLAAALGALGRREGVTLFITLLAAFKLLLHRYSGQEDIVVGTPMANRGRREVEGLIGYFVNMVPLRTDLSGNPTFRDLLSRVRQTTLGAYAHQDVPLQKLLKELHLEREAGRMNPFPAVFGLQNAPMSPLKLTNVTISAVDVFKQTTPADLYFAATETGDGIALSLKYSVDIFDDKMIAGMLSNFAGLLESVVAEPDCRLLEIPFREGSKSSGEADQKARSYGADQFSF